MAATHRPLSPVARLGIDFGPLLVFFLANLIATRFVPGLPANRAVFVATGAFMAATAAAMIASRLLTGGVSKMLLFSGVMVLGFGGLTLWLQDETFIKVKPTIYYVMVSAILFFGLWTGRPTLKVVLEMAYPGLSDRGWAILSRNWAIFFLAMAAGNELVWRTMSTEFWIGYKLWGVFPLTLLFAFAHVPTLMKHGLDVNAAKPGKVEAEQTPPQG